MIQGLIDSLRTLAGPAEVRLARVPDFPREADELALDFEDALLLVSDCSRPP